MSPRTRDPSEAAALAASEGSVRDSGELKVLVGRALDVAARREGALSATDVERIASELGISRDDLDAARRELERDAAAEAELRARAAASRRTWAYAVIVAAGLGAGAGALWARGAAPQLLEHESATRAAAARLESALERQVRLAPQLLALASVAESPALRRAREVAQAGTLEARLGASRAVGDELAAALATAQPRADDEQARALRYELVGAENRISVESQRWRQQLASWQTVSRSPSARLACTLGFAACAPPR